MTMIYELVEGEPDIKKVAEYSLPPKQALVCYVRQHLFHDFNTSSYPQIVPGMRESDTVMEHWYYDNYSVSPLKRNSVLAAYPA